VYGLATGDELNDVDSGNAYWPDPCSDFVNCAEFSITAPLSTDPINAPNTYDDAVDATPPLSFSHTCWLDNV
jgi:hypothetical protein